MGVWITRRWSSGAISTFIGGLGTVGGFKAAWLSVG